MIRLQPLYTIFIWFFCVGMRDMANRIGIFLKAYSVGGGEVDVRR